MTVTMQRHPLLQRFFDARRGEPLTGEHRIAQLAIINQSNTKSNSANSKSNTESNTPDRFTVNVLRIARDNNINSQAVVEMLDWMLEAGFFAPVGPRHYTFTNEFKRLAGH